MGARRRPRPQHDRATSRAPIRGTAVQAAGRLEVDRAAEKLVDEGERLVVLHDAIALADDPKHLAGVLTDRCEEAGDLLAAWQQLIATRLVEHGTQAVPGGLAYREHGVRVSESSGHLCLLQVGATPGAGPVAAPGRSPARGCDNARRRRVPHRDRRG